MKCSILKVIFKTDPSHLLCLVFVSLSLVLSTYCFPVLIFCFYLYLNLCLAREFTYATLGMLFAWHCQMLVFFTSGRVCGVRADLRSLVLISVAAVRIP